MPPHSLVEPPVVQGLANILEAHPIGREDLVNELVVLALVLYVGGEVSQDFSELGAEVAIEVFGFGEFLVGAASHAGVFPPLLFYPLAAPLLVLLSLQVVHELL